MNPINSEKKEYTIPDFVKENLETADLLDNWIEMLNESNKALKQFPDNPLLLSYRIKALLNTKNEELAYSEAKASCKKHPNHTSLLLTTMKVAENRNDFKTVYDVANTLSKMLPLNEDVKAALTRSQEKISSSKIENLIDMIEEARKRLKNKENQEAYNTADTILKLEPSLKAALIIKAEAALRLNKIDEAHSLSLTVIIEYPNNFIRYVYARALFLKKDYVKAKVQAEMTLKKFPEMTHAKSTIALVEFYTGKFKEAYRLSKEILDLCPDNVLMIELYAEAACAIGKFNEAYDLSSKWAEISDDKLSPLCLKVSAAAFGKDMKTANDLLDSAIKDHPENKFIKATQSLLNDQDCSLESMEIKEEVFLKSHAFPGYVLAIRKHLENQNYDEALKLSSSVLKENALHPVFLRFGMRAAIKGKSSNALFYAKKLKFLLPNDHEANEAIKSINKNG